MNRWLILDGNAKGITKGVRNGIDITEICPVTITICGGYVVCEGILHDMATDIQQALFFIQRRHKLHVDEARNTALNIFCQWAFIYLYRTNQFCRKLFITHATAGLAADNFTAIHGGQI